MSKHDSVMVGLCGALLVFAALTATSGAEAREPIAPAEALLTRSIAYHDPNGLWSRSVFVLDLTGTRPEGPDRQSRVTIDTVRGDFSLTEERDGVKVERSLVAGECAFRVDGSASYSDEQADALGLSCERLTRMRDYHAYLWGLPMKLRDPGTRLDPNVKSDTFDDREALALRVTYDESVGSDIWYFYFDPKTAALIGYRFYHDEEANDGEYITLANEIIQTSSGEPLEGGPWSVRLPRERTWYTHQEDKVLGTDTLTGLTVSKE